MTVDAHHQKVGSGIGDGGQQRRAHIWTRHGCVSVGRQRGSLLEVCSACHARYATDRFPNYSD